jgi:hypothetical protein
MGKALVYNFMLQHLNVVFFHNSGMSFGSDKAIFSVLTVSQIHVFTVEMLTFTDKIELSKP